MSHTKPIRLTRFQHKKIENIGVHFDYDFTVKEYVKKFSDIRWTRTYNCFYVVFTEQTANALCTYLRKGGYKVDYSNLNSTGTISKQRILQNQSTRYDR